MNYVNQKRFGDPPGPLTANDLRQHGCGAATASNMLIKNSGGKWVPQGKNGAASAAIRVERSGVTTAEFRQRGLTTDEMIRTLEAVDSSDERMALTTKWYKGKDVRDVILPRLVESRGSAAVPVKNSVLAAAGKSPFPSFKGGHWLLLVAVIGDEVAYVDPGNGKVSKMPISLLVRAMERFGDNRDVGLADKSWGRGLGNAVIGYPWLTWREGYGDMKASRDKARSERDAARDQRDRALEGLAECQAQGPDAAALAEARRKGIADAAAAAAATE